MTAGNSLLYFICSVRLSNNQTLCILCICSKMLLLFIWITNYLFVFLSTENKKLFYLISYFLLKLLMNASLFVEEVTHISCFLLNQRAADYIYYCFFLLLLLLILLPVQVRSTAAYNKKWNIFFLQTFFFLLWFCFYFFISYNIINYI